MRIGLIVFILATLAACTSPSGTGGGFYTPACIVVTPGGSHSAPDVCATCPASLLTADGCAVDPANPIPCLPACPDGAARSWATDTTGD